MPTPSDSPRSDAEGAHTDDLGLGDGLVQLSFTVQSVLARLADTHGLTLTQVRLLGVLADREIGMQQLAGILELEKSSVTGLVDRAERRGLVRRVPVPGNGRATHVVLTPEAQSLAATLRRGVHAEIERLTAHLDVPQQRALRRGVSSVLDAYAAHHHIPR